MYYIKANNHIIEKGSFRTILALARYCSHPERLTLDTYCVYAGKTPDYKNRDLEKAEDEASRFGLSFICYESDEKARKACKER